MFYLTQDEFSKSLLRAYINFGIQDKWHCGIGLFQANIFGFMVYILLSD